MKKIIYLAIFWLPLVVPLWGQTTFTGHVEDSDNEPLIGASILLVGTETGLQLHRINQLWLLHSKKTNYNC